MLSIQTGTCFKPRKKTYSKKHGKPRTPNLSILTGVTSLYERISHAKNGDTEGKGRQVNPEFLTLSVLPSSSVSGKRGIGRMCVYQKEKSKCLSYFIQSPHCPGKNKIHVQVQATKYKLHNFDGSTKELNVFKNGIAQYKDRW